MFSGCGGLDWGFKMAGFDVVFANDSDRWACETYRANIGAIECRNVASIDVDEFPECDIVIGGFPCQGFSTAGWFKPGDCRNALYTHIVRVVASRYPPVFCLENVRGLMSMGRKHGETIGPVLRSILRDFNDIGYTVCYVLFHLEQYGVPQRRRRLFIVGTRADLNAYWEPPRPIYGESGGPVFVNCDEVMAEFEGSGARRARGAINNVQSRYKLRRGEPSRYTILASSAKIPIHYDEPLEPDEMDEGYYPMRLTFEDCRALQGFPPFLQSQVFMLGRLPLGFNKPFTFAGSFTSKIRQVGNAVPPLFAYQIARSLARFLGGISR